MVGHGTDKVRAPDVFLELQSGVVVPASLTALISVVPAAEAGSGGERFDEFSCLVQCFRNQGIVSVLGGAVLDSAVGGGVGSEAIAPVEVDVGGFGEVSARRLDAEMWICVIGGDQDQLGAALGDPGGQAVELLGLQVIGVIDDQQCSFIDGQGRVVEVTKERLGCVGIALGRIGGRLAAGAVGDRKCEHLVFAGDDAGGDGAQQGGLVLVIVEVD